MSANTTPAGAAAVAELQATEAEADAVPTKKSKNEGINRRVRQNEKKRNASERNNILY